MNGRGVDGDRLYRGDSHATVAEAPRLPRPAPRGGVEAGDFTRLQADVDLICLWLGLAAELYEQHQP